MVFSWSRTKTKTKKAGDIMATYAYLRVSTIEQNTEKTNLMF